MLANIAKRISKNKHSNKPALAKKRNDYEKYSLYSYLDVCVDVGQINKASKVLLKHAKLDTQHYNVVIKGCAKLGLLSQVTDARLEMIRRNVKPDTETFASTLLAHSKASETTQPNTLKQILHELKSKNICLKTLFQSTYLSVGERKAIKTLLRTVDSKFNDAFVPFSTSDDCKLLDKLRDLPPEPYNFAGQIDLSKLDVWAEQQRMVEWKSSVTIKSVANNKQSNAQTDKFVKLWHRYQEMWRKSLSQALDENLADLRTQYMKTNKIHIYPYLCTLDKNLLINLMLDEIENNAIQAKWSMATHLLHIQLGSKVRLRYMKAKSISDGSHHEVQKIYTEYLEDYCKNPDLLGRINSREYIQKRAAETKNYAIYKDVISPTPTWPFHILAAVGRFLYGIMLKEVKFDPDTVKNPKKEIKTSKMVHAFYTAYMQIDCTHKIKEEFRGHQDFEKLYLNSCSGRLRFDYSFLPCSSPPMPWISQHIGGYLTNKTDLVRSSNSANDKLETDIPELNPEKLYPTIDSLNALSLCPWIVNKEILDIVISLFRIGGDADLAVPLDEAKMELYAPILKNESTKADRIMYNKDKKKYEQKKREMYSLWRDCLYRLSIANHFRDRIFWFPHNIDFRGRTYPVPPHFNHLGSDLARSLLLFARGKPLGDKGLDWLKVHLINLVGNMKSKSIQERLDYANSILHLEVLDSADNPWDGRRWWTRNECPWQVLACCKEIARAIRSKDHRQYISHFPVHQDGSCNGLQHYAALGRDPEGAKAVNLTPSDKPQDVYSRVVEIVEEHRQKDEAKGNKVAASLKGYIERKVVKQTVMTTVYGVTRYGARAQIARQLASKGFPEQEIWRAAQYLSSKTFESIGQMFIKSRLIQDWFNKCAFIIASRGKKPVAWITPLGFLVVQPYTQTSVSSCSTRLLCPEIGICLPVYNSPQAQLNAPKQKTAFPPNYIHSLDSSHMMLTSLYCQRQGISFVSVHDCYWTHPSTVDVMNKVCREQFVALHSEPLLEQLSQQFLEQFLPNKDNKINAFKQNMEHVISQGGYSMNCVDEEDFSDVEVKKAAKLHNHRVRTLAQKVEDSAQNAELNYYQIFSEVPTKGNLNLEEVLKSTYFFS